MLIKTRPELPSSEITPESVYVNRRTFMRAAIAAGAGAALAGPGSPLVPDASAQAGNVWPIANAAKSPLSTDREGQRLRGHHRLQQLLRVRHRQERPGALRRAS